MGSFGNQTGALTFATPHRSQYNPPRRSWRSTR